MLTAFISSWFITCFASTDVILSAQVHQLSLTALLAEETMRWSRILDRPDQIRVFHLSATPKPADLILGNITETSAGNAWKSLKADADWYNQSGTDIKERVDWMADLFHEHENRLEHGESESQNKQKAMDMNISLLYILLYILPHIYLLLHVYY